MSASRRGGNHASPAKETRERRQRTRRADLNDLTVTEIKSRLKERNTEFASSDRKDDLIDKLIRAEGL